MGIPAEQLSRDGGSWRLNEAQTPVSSRQRPINPSTWATSDSTEVNVIITEWRTHWEASRVMLMTLQASGTIENSFEANVKFSEGQSNL